MAISREQTMKALEIANRKRLARAKLKRQIRSGEVDLADVISLKVDPVIALEMDVLTLLTSVHRIGPSRAGAILYRAGIRPDWVTLGTLSANSRQRLMGAYVATVEGAKAA